jgi:hypothetical protein
VIGIVLRHGTVIVVVGLLVLGLLTGGALADDGAVDPNRNRYFYGKML